MFTFFEYHLNRSSLQQHCIEIQIQLHAHTHTNTKVATKKITLVYHIQDNKTQSGHFVSCHNFLLINIENVDSFQRQETKLECSCPFNLNDT